MKKILWNAFAALFILLTLTAHANPGSEEHVPYKEAKRYFVRNDYPGGSSLLKITSEEELNSILGIAPTAYEDATEIDFSKQYAVVKIFEHSANTYNLTGFIKNGKALEMYYTNEERNGGANYRYCIVVILDKKYQGELRAVETKHKPLITYTQGKNYFIKNTFPEGTALLKITSTNELEKVMGYATTMGKDGKPTEIDFTKQQALVIIFPESNGNSYELKSVLQTELGIEVGYKKTYKKTSHTSRYYLMAIIDKNITGQLYTSEQ